MNLEWKVPTLEQCKKLVKLGVVLDTEKSWTEDRRLLFSDLILRSDIKRFPAPDVAELGELLPTSILVPDNHGIKYKYHLRLKKTGTGFRVSYINHIGDIFHTELLMTEAQARCAALIWLIENGYIKPEDINGR